ncbi:hypothetical protein B4114_3092 [Geobacillus stearothermophilus]|uniref:Uncharacterized protein n=1 Tax=Geobacillus stearothermophilus TaxID=1422 RepID=A0A150NAU8_GEOSE|nr:hypothetical protein B4114_3092 [Geobacillus stearothermophilus]
MGKNQKKIHVKTVLLLTQGKFTPSQPFVKMGKASLSREEK